MIWSSALWDIGDTPHGFPENQTFRKSFFRREHMITCIMTLGPRSSYHLIFVIENKLSNAGAETVSSLAIKHHVIKQPTIPAMAERKLKVFDLNCMKIPLGLLCVWL